MALSAATLRKVVEALNNSTLDEHEIRSITDAISQAHDAASAGVPATATVFGTVKKSTAVADIATVVGAAAPAGGVGTAAGGWDTSANRDAAIATINNNRTAIIELKAQLNSLLAAQRTASQLTT